MSSFYGLNAISLQGGEISMEAFAGQVVLVVNTASQCGLTPQYAALEKLHETYKAQGFVILGFPCDQFGHQEPGGAAEISRTCHVNYGVTFPMFAKIAVNGDKAHPVFRYLKESLPGLLGSAVKWNFTKFLLDRQGMPVRRFAPITKPEKIATSIESLLSQNS